MRSLVVPLQEACRQSRVPVEIPWIDYHALVVNALQTGGINMRNPAITARYSALHLSADMETIELLLIMKPSRPHRATHHKHSLCHNLIMLSFYPHRFIRKLVEPNHTAM